MPELAVGYVSLVAETSKMGPAIKRALGQADGDAAAAGKSMGSKMSSALGTALKGGVATAGAAALGGIGFALTKGFSRLNTIDQAQAKLRALGSSGEEVKSIMDNALAAVKGTSFGLGDAAGLAGTMVAAGIKPGQELEKTLRLVADSAAIAGTDLNDMGMIWGKIAAKGKLDGETLDQLMERQIGILPELAKNYGVTTEEAAKMVSEGKVSFEDFSRVMTEKVGGGAEEMGQTVAGAFENMKAAAGRIGATALEPIFKALPGGFSGITEAMDALEPKIGAFVEMISNKAVAEFGPKVRESAMAAWQALEGAGVVDQTRDTFMQLINTGQQLAPTVVRIATSIASVSASLGVGTWQVFMAALSGVASVMSALEPVFSAIADVMEAQPALVGAAIIGWMAFRSVPGMVTRVGTVTSSLTQKLSGLVRASALSAASESALATASTNLARAQTVAASAAAKVLIAEENLMRVRATAGATAGQVAAAEARVAEARLASTTAATRATAAQAGMTAAQAAAARQTQTFGSTMRTAYQQGASGAQRFSRTAGVANASLTAMGRGASGLMGMMGGPWGIAMVGATVGVMALTSHIQKNKQKAKEAEQAAKQYEASVTSVGAALQKTRGVVDDSVFSALTKQVELGLPKVDSMHTALSAFGGSGVWGGFQSTEDALAKLGMTTEDVAKKVLGSSQQWEMFVAQLARQGVGSAALLQLQGMRIEFENQRNLAARVTPGVREFSDAVDTLGSKAASTSDKLSAIKAAMDALSPARSKAEAMRQMGDALRQTTAAASEIGPSAFNAKGELDAMGESGGKLSEVLGNLAEKQQQVAATGDGAAIARTNQQIETSLQALAASTNKPIEKIRELYQQMGGGKNIDLMIKLAGAPEAVQGLGTIQAAMTATPNAKKIEVPTDSIKAALPVLDQLKIKYTTMPDGKTVRIDVSGDAGAKLQSVINTANQIPPGKTVVTTAPGGQGVFELLKGMNASVRVDNNKNIEVVSPLAPGVLDLLRQIGFEVETKNGKNIIVRANDDDLVNKKAQNRWTDTEYKQIVVQATGAASGTFDFARGIFRANGAIVPARAYVDGGIQAAESFANGGLKEISKPTRADIFAGRGDGTIFAEKETGGEAYIPLARGKRSRSTEILAAVAKMFGLELVPRDGSISGLLGGLAGGAVSKLLQKAGVDGLKRFADGGFNAKQLRDLAGGAGASQPLTGAPYVWGGVNWGDCSGAMSAFTRAAAGLAPFGGRWSTGSAASDLPAMGFKQGRGGAGDMRVGFYNGGAGGGHTAGTLPDGTNVEMGGGNGGGMVGGSVGANSPQFTDHWFLPVDPGRIDQVTSLIDENLGTDGTSPTYTPSTTSTVDKPTSLSDLVGNAAKTAVAGQVADVLNVFGINDSPGALAAWAGLPVPQSSTTKSVDPKKLREAQDRAADKETALKVAKQRLAEVEANKKSKASAKLAARAAVEKAEREAEQAKADLEKVKSTPTVTAAAPSGTSPTVRDPGTHRPKKGEDTGVGKLSSVDAIKNAFKGGLREAWRSGDQWSATDWIVNKESTWKPDAQNGKYWGLIQAGEDVYRAAGVDPKTTDPAQQAKAYDKYVAGRYQTPVGAKAHWDQEGWYDVGGVIHEGTTLMKNGLGHKETALPFDPHDLRDRLDRGGSSDETNALLRELIAEIRNADLGTTHATFRNEQEYFREQRQRTRTRAMAGMGGRP
ncbi:tape measure protein [Gordonia malaquae]|uniref:aggregation-promoting factor C-terminal-like domain-containing protein n=1 Tax=Gordonia malaquae TaxID=410332 RepID=UPI0030C79BD8